MSLLSSHKKLEQPDTLKQNSASIDTKRQFIHDQLELIRKQRDQLKSQHAKSNATLNQLASNQPNNKNGRMSGVNLNLSTIKEVDTPKSERCLKLNQSSNKQKYNVQEVSASFIMSADSTFENVTELNETCSETFKRVNAKKYIF